jgi:hypothetical protein
VDTRRSRRAASTLHARLTLSVLAAAWVAAPLSSAWADEPNAEQVAAARSLGTEGVRLAEAGDCARAVDPLTRAESLHHAPTTLERLGECHIAIGKLVLGTEELNRVIRDALPPNAPAAFRAAQGRARTAIDPALARIGKLRIHVERPAGVEPSVKVDDEAVMGAMLDADRPTDPGLHKVSVSGPGMKPSETSVTLADGQSQSVALTLEPDPLAVSAPPVTPLAPATTTAPSPGGGAPDVPAAQPRSKVPAIVVLGAGAVGLAVGSVFGILALGTKSTLDGACVNKSCPASSQSDINSLGTNATISTIGFGVGIVGVAVGTILFVTSSGSSNSTSASIKAKALQPHATPYLGLGTAGLTGTF